MIKLLDILREAINKPSKEEFEQEYGNDKDYNLTNFLDQHQNYDVPLKGKIKEQFLHLMNLYPNVKKLIEKSNCPIYVGNKFSSPYYKDGKLNSSSFNLIYDFGGAAGPLKGNNVVVIDKYVDPTIKNNKVIQADLTEPLEQLPPADAINMTHSFNNMSLGNSSIVSKNINQSLKPGGIIFIADSLNMDLDSLFKYLSSYKILDILINDNFQYGGDPIVIAILQK